MGNTIKSLSGLPKNRLSGIGKKVVVITGCDSGLGYSLSLKFQDLGLTVVSGCLDTKSQGATSLSRVCHVFDLDVTDSRSVQTFVQRTIDVTRDGENELYALVNNAGQMIFGEFEWYTERQIEQQVEVNLMGSFRMAKAFLPHLRKSKGRIINVTSHCAYTNLPTLTVYGATKAALQSWSDGLRMEQQKYGVKIISFVPGSFASQSNIMTSQQFHSEEMEKAFGEEDRKFYGAYFNEFNRYLSFVSGERKPLVPIKDDVLYSKFLDALLSENPRIKYKHEPWRYFLYYNSFRVAPTRLKDYLVNKFMMFPQFKGNCIK
ncbi:hypothetical protein RUM43_007047 [Polyplax serrata]|uniref:Uncharacterized protein n=1 Tax=Polyplax serrata TaxID=468196 RepID=A0AAN8S131_POLSC